MVIIKDDIKKTLAAFLQKHPWEEQWLALGSPLEYFFLYDLDEDPETIWPVLSDTSEINRRIGLPEIEYREENGRRYGKGLLGRRMHHWEELPWQWEYGRSILIERLYTMGWCHYARVFIILEPGPGNGTRLTVNFGWIPRNRVSALMLWLGRPGMMKKYGAAIDTLVKESRPQNPGFFIADYPSQINIQSMTAQTENPRIPAIAQKLKDKGFDEGIVEKFINYVKTAPGNSLFRMKPKALALSLEIDYRVLLELMLNATSEGLLNMSWDLVCPHCRGVRKRASHLWDVPLTSACEVCRIDFDASDINTIEITFHPNPDIKKTEETFYCSAEPAKKNHILVQKNVKTGEHHSLALNLQEGRYRMRLTGSKTFSYLDISRNDEQRDLYWDHLTPGASFECSPGSYIRLSNGGPVDYTFVLENNTEDNYALRPRDLFGLQEFRDLFSEEALSVNLSIDVGVQVISFVDIVGSSAMYVSQGNARAFAMVKNFIEKSHDVAKKRDGAIIKSMGDAVLISFISPLAALKASMDLLKIFNGSDPDAPFNVRITVNSGPCMAVNLNSAIDYFGSPVNTVAKLQKYTGTGEIGITAPIVNDHAVSSYLAERGFNFKRVKKADLPGIGTVEYWTLKIRRR